MLKEKETSENQQEAFREALARLNDQQREAVMHTEGPVLVVAGPGTGKTQILAARIGHILNTTDAQPSNILCLTYTDAGTIAMRERLKKFIGAEAYKVGIFTFHAFCNRVIKDNMEQFGMRALDSITELEQAELLRKLIDGFGKDHVLKRWTGDVYYDSYRLGRLFQIMKTENWSAELISQKADEYIADLPNREEYLYKRADKKRGFQKGDVKQALVDKEVQKMAELKAAAGEFERYEQLMAQRKRYDYNDMLLLVLNKFKSDESFLRQYQEQYQYLLVDEFQDTNGTQNEILNQLVDFWEEPNVFAVGDDDQSIFRFQGANVSNILDFNSKYNPRVIVMTDNYRSSQHILEVSRTLIESNNERLVNEIPDLSKLLQAHHELHANTDIKPEIREYKNKAQEAVDIALHIEELYQQGVDLNEIAVIYRNHKQADEIVRYLEAKGIPVNIKRKANILESRFINKLIDILTYIRKEAEHPFSREDLLFEIMHFDFYDTEPLVLARLAMEVRNKKGEDAPYWRELIQTVGSRAENTLFADSGKNKTYANLQKLSTLLEGWIKDLHNTTLQVLFEKILTQGGVLQYVMRSPDKFELMQELTTFFDFIKQESVKDPQVSLSQFLDTVKLMRDDKLQLPIQKTLSTENGVNFVTAHSSKGLEFEGVFLMSCQASEWEKKARSGTFAIPDNLATSIGNADESEEQRRLFYVALTRAKKYLHISYYLEDNDGKQQEHSRYVQEISDHDHLTTHRVDVPADKMLEYNLQVMQEERLPELPLVEEAYLRKVLENYSLSVTHLNSYLKCPVSYYYSYMLRIPVAKNQYMAFGSAVHFALERLFRYMMNNEKSQFGTPQQLVKDFQWYMHRHKDSFTDEEFGRRLEYGSEILPRYYNEYVKGWNTVVTVERNFRAVVEAVPINGKLDKIEFDGHNANVVDYKTGKFDYNKKRHFKQPADEFKKDEPTYEEQYGGDYWRQAVFYKLLVDNEPSKNWNVVSTEFDFVEPDPKTGQFHKEKVVITPDDLETVRQQIKETYAKIQNLEFSQGCNDPGCQWCNFLKNNFSLDPDLISTVQDELETE